MKVVKATGMVPVFEERNKDHIFGVMPDVAAENLLSGKVFLVEIPDSIETEEVHVPGWDDRDSKKNKGEGPEVSEAGLVKIPDDWESKHHMTQNRLAKSILGDGYLVPEGTKASEYDETVIREEIARRAAAADENQS